MQCNRCRATLPAGATVCPYCANPTPYNAGSSPSNTLPPPPPPTNYGQPPYAPPPQYGPPVMVPVPVPPRKTSGCGIAALVVCLILFVVGVLVVGIGGVAVFKHNADATATSMEYDATATADDATYTAQLTPTPYPPYTESDSPSGADFSEAAQQVIPSAQLANEVDGDNRPTSLQSHFSSGDTIYLVYKWAQGNTGYVMTRWYMNGQKEHEKQSSYIGANAAGYGYMAYDVDTYDDVTIQGIIEVFWCQDSACEHGGLAWARPFTVTP